MLHNARHKPLPRKPDPKTTRHRKRKRVTVIAGFQCSDGILLCADSEETIGEESKSQTRKIATNASHFSHIAIGGAGDSALIDYVQQKLIRDMLDERPSWDAFEGWLNNYANTVFTDHVQPYAYFPSDRIPEDVEFLVALRMDEESRLFKWERNFAYAVPPKTHTSIGFGTLQSRSELSNLERISLPAHQMLFYAVRAMLKVKQTVQYCGGNTEVVQLHNGGMLSPFRTSEIQAIEHMVEEVDFFVLQRVLRLIARPISAKSDQELDAQVKALRDFNETYQQLVKKFWRG